MAIDTDDMRQLATSGLIPEHLLTPIRTAADADAFLTALDAEGRLFHLDDDPADVVNYHGPIFASYEVPFVRDRHDELLAVKGYNPWAHPAFNEWRTE